MAKQNRSRDRVHYVKLSEKEIAIMREEHDDKNGAQRNIPMMRHLLLTDPELSGMLYDPSLLPMLMAQVIRNLNSQHMFTSETTQNEEFLQAISHALLPHFNPSVILNDLIRVVKERKIKREKRTLLWACGDLMAIVYQRMQPQQSAVFQTIVTTSIDNATRLSQLASIIREGKEPYHFNYEDYMEGPVPQEKFEKLHEELGPQLPSLQRIMSLWAMEAFENIKKPFGFPFYDILQYPSAFPQKKSSLIITSSHEDETQDKEENDEEKYRKILEALRKDRMLMTAQEVAKKVVDSMKSAAFGELAPDQLNGYLNAATFSLLFPFIDNPLLVRMYEFSGEHAGDLIAEDEKGDWIEINSDPDNPRLYQLYGDTLLAKENWHGARKAYIRAHDLMDEPTEELKTKLNDLNKRLYEEDQQMMQQHQQHSHVHDENCNHDHHETVEE